MQLDKGTRQQFHARYGRAGPQEINAVGLNTVLLIHGKP